MQILAPDIENLNGLIVEQMKAKRERVSKKLERMLRAEYNSVKRDRKLPASAICHYCEKNIATGYDHIIPVILGGQNAEANLVPCCGSCNSRKGGRIHDTLKKALCSHIENYNKMLEPDEPGPTKDHTFTPIGQQIDELRDTNGKLSAENERFNKELRAENERFKAEHERLRKDMMLLEKWYDIEISRRMAQRTGLYEHTLHTTSIR